MRIKRISNCFVYLYFWFYSNENHISKYIISVNKETDMKFNYVSLWLNKIVGEPKYGCIFGSNSRSLPFSHFLPFFLLN